MNHETAINKFDLTVIRATMLGCRRGLRIKRRRRLVNRTTDSWRTKRGRDVVKALVLWK